MRDARRGPESPNQQGNGGGQNEERGDQTPIDFHDAIIHAPERESKTTRLQVTQVFRPIFVAAQKCETPLHEQRQREKHSHRNSVRADAAIRVKRGFGVG